MKPPRSRATGYRRARMSNITCVRCETSVPANETDFFIDGAVCRRCTIATTVRRHDTSTLARELARSTARKRVITGLAMLGGGITIILLGVSGGGLVVVPTGMVLAGAVELTRGMAGPV